MELAQDSVQELRIVLGDCTAHLRVGTTGGSGFFIDEDLLLTCDHVVKDADEVVVTPLASGKPCNGRVVDRDQSKDLALIQIEHSPDIEAQSAVTLHRGMEGGVYLAAGYPKFELDPRPGFEMIRYEGHTRSDFEDKSDLVLIYDAGKQVTSGMSGGPVLNTATGAVVAVTRFANDLRFALGGGAIPITIAADSFEEVRRCLDQPPTATRRWRDALGPDGWTRLGYTWEAWKQAIDLYVSGKRSGWRIGLSDDASGEEITVQALGDDVSEALFQWAQRQRVRGKDQVILLGKLLSAALFPDAVKKKFLTARQADDLLLRLHVAPSSGLTDIPWEFAAVPGGGDEAFLAIQSDLAFIRVAPSPGLRPVSNPRPGTPPIRVLGVIVQPDKWQKQLRVVRQWKVDKNDIESALRAKVERHHGRWKAQVNRETADVKAVAADDQYEVFHYIGFGAMLDRGGAHVAMYDGPGSDPRWEPVEDFFKLAAQSNAQVVVVEFGSPPPDVEAEPIPPSALIQAALDVQLNAAIVFTRYPVQPRQWQVFNDGFYEALGDRETVEMAVQRGRQRLWDNKPLSDAATFGWFTVVSGTAAHTQLASKPDGQPELEAKQDSPPAGAGQARRFAEERPDEFAR